MLFSDRQEAGKQLASKLTSYKGRIPCSWQFPGWVPVAYEVYGVTGKSGSQYHGKFRPHYSELALGAVAQDGSIVLNEEIVIAWQYRRNTFLKKLAPLAEIERRLHCYRGKALPFFAGKTVIVIDDGWPPGLPCEGRKNGKESSCGPPSFGGARGAPGKYCFSKGLGG